MKRLHRSTYGPLAVMTCAAGVLRFSTLGLQSFWVDESVTGHLMHLSFQAMLRALPDSESTPPLYYAAAWLWTRVFGVSEVGLRSLSALAGTVAVPVVYFAAERWFGRRAALIAGALAAFNPLLWWYSQEARAYSLLVLLCAISLWLLSSAAASTRGWRAPMLWALVASLALATHYFALFVIGPQALWLAIRRGRAAAPALALLTVAAISVAPLAVHQRANNGARFITESPLGTRLIQLPKQFLLGYDSPNQVVLLAAAVVLLALSAPMLWRARGGGPALALAAIALAVPIALTPLGLDYVSTRNVIAAWVPAAAALAVGLAAGGRCGTAVSCGICVLGAVAIIQINSSSAFQREDWRGATSVLTSRDTVVIAAASGRPALEYYLPRSTSFRGGSAARIQIIVFGLRRPGTPAAVPRPPAPSPPAGFAPAAVRHGATWVVFSYEAIARPAPVTVAELTQMAGARTGAPAILLL